MTTTVETLQAADYTAYKVGKALYVYLSPFLLILGLVGNILCFLVMSKRARKPPPTYLYLTVLAVADVFALYLPCVRGWLAYMINVDLMLLMGCSWYFIVYFSLGNISVYIIVCVTIDRFIHTFFPLSAKK
jgi:growth hormone secretagogue receptor